MARTSKKALKKPVEPPTPPPPPEPYHDAQALQNLHQEALEAIQELADEYGATETPERILDKAKAILSAPTLEEAVLLRRRSWDSMLVHVLSQWAKGKIPGKMSDLSFERRVKKAQDLAVFLDSKGLWDQADTQRKRADKLQDEWDAFKLEVSSGS